MITLVCSLNRKIGTNCINPGGCALEEYSTVVELIKFVEFEKRLARSGKTFLDLLGPAVGKASVVSITRDDCPACERQKPRFERLAEKVASDYGDKVAFFRVHVEQPPGDVSESLRAKDVFRHYFYPTCMVLVRTRDRGAVELHKTVSSNMNQLKSIIRKAVDIAVAIAKERK